jgi:hypothetical protein
MIIYQTSSVSLWWGLRRRNSSFALIIAVSSMPLPLSYWTFEENKCVFQAIPPTDYPKLFKEIHSQVSGADFFSDFSRANKILNLQVHPLLANNIYHNNNVGSALENAEKDGKKLSKSNSSSKLKVSNSGSAPNKQQIIEEKLSELRLFGYAVDLGSIVCLGLVLPHFKQIHSLKFHNSSLTVQTLSTLAEILPNTAIISLAIDFNPLQPDESPRDRSAADIVDASEVNSVWSLFLGANSSLHSLSLRGNHLNNSSLQHIFKALVVNKPLIHLDLSHNTITDSICEFLADSLALNNTLQFINLANNFISNTGNSILSSVFLPKPIENREEAKTLKTQGYHLTNLKNTYYRDANSTLKFLDLSYNLIDSKGIMQWIEQCYLFNSTLQNSWREEEKTELQQAKREKLAKHKPSPSNGAAISNSENSSGISSPAYQAAAAPLLSNGARREVVRAQLIAANPALQLDKEIKFNGQFNRLEAINLSGNPGDIGENGRELVQHIAAVLKLENCGKDGRYFSSRLLVPDESKISIKLLDGEINGNSKETAE